MGARMKCRNTCGALVALLAVAGCLWCQTGIAQEEQARNHLTEEYDEIVNLNERLRDELSELNSDFDQLRTLQRWMFALVGLGALSLGFVLGYLGRHLKATAKAS